MNRIGKALARAALAAVGLAVMVMGTGSAQENSSPLTIATATGLAHIMPLPAF
jgi:hypothetical protein